MFLLQNLLGGLQITWGGSERNLCCHVFSYVQLCRVHGVHITAVILSLALSSPFFQLLAPALRTVPFVARREGFPPS